MRPNENEQMSELVIFFSGIIAGIWFAVESFVSDISRPARESFSFSRPARESCSICHDTEENCSFSRASAAWVLFIWLVDMRTSVAMKACRYKINSHKVKFPRRAGEIVCVCVCVLLMRLFAARAGACSSKCAVEAFIDICLFVCFLYQC